jgi:transcriptional regulator with XRE-family HTH domain
MTERVQLLIKLAKDQGWTQRKISDDLMVSLRAVEYWFAGTQSPRLRSQRDIDDLLRKYKVI